MHSQHRMNYELRAIRFNHSGSIFGAENVGKICTLRGKGKNKEKQTKKTKHMTTVSHTG